MLATESIIKIPLKITIINKVELSQLVTTGRSVINQTGAGPDSELYKAVDAAAALLLTNCTQQEVNLAVYNLRVFSAFQAEFSPLIFRSYLS